MKRRTTRHSDRKEESKKENPNCPSYDCGFCTTAPQMHEMKCINLPECYWKNYDFKKENQQ